MKHAILLMALGLLAGCASELDTGYAPKKLGVTTEERRAYYAPAFTPESMSAQSGSGTTPRRR